MTDAQVDEIAELRRVIDELKKEIIWLKAVARELTDAISVLTEKDERAQRFIQRIQELSD